MKAILAALGVIAGVTGLSAFAGYKSRAVPAGSIGASPAALQARIMAIFNTPKSTPAYAAALKYAAETATALGMLKTAKGLMSDSGLPTDETWPGTNQSVSAYINEQRSKK